ncbi:hypothetical protein GCK72_017137 [Caenorhabditis remanei]|uniref:Transmembrane protein n=1 Tax=Caenorhabditis remanei TaxID=31234 RepID=A0A6A5G6V8_CAERE|nr:hypothetical protein GCK72_017137 [Caenorhabditis remanei]KAF1750586.1 hypothetical protein GCK72_017137 [Caenorhabditis remanei]
MKILVIPKKEQLNLNLISTLSEEFLLEDSRKQSQQQVVSFSKLLLKQSGKLGKDSKPTEEESLQLDNLRNTLNTQWKEKRDLVGKTKIDVCYAKITMLVLTTIIYASDTVCVLQTQAVKYITDFIIMGILLSLVVLYNLMKLCRRIIAPNKLDVENGTEKQICFGNMELSFMEQLEKCVGFYSKEVMPLKEEARALSKYSSLWIKSSLIVFVPQAVAMTIYCIIVAFKLLDNESIIAAPLLLLGYPFIAATAFIFIVAILETATFYITIKTYFINEALEEFNNDSPFVVVVLFKAIIFTILGLALVVGFLEFNDIEI